MLKKILYSIIAFISFGFSNLFAIGETPKINCEGLPGCGASGNNDVKIVEKISSNIITNLIQYIAVLAVIALMISGIMYMLSGGEEEKTKKAKAWIIWSLVGVLISISSYYIVSVIANINTNI